MWEKIRYAGRNIEVDSWTTFHPMASKIFIEDNYTLQLPCSVPDKGCGHCKEPDDCWRVKGLSFFYNVIMKERKETEKKREEERRGEDDVISILPQC